MGLEVGVIKVADVDSSGAVLCKLMCRSSAYAKGRIRSCGLSGQEYKKGNDQANLLQ
jgi:hypothetical protein